MDSQKIARLLPGVFQHTLPENLHDPKERSPLAALLTLMERLQQPIEDILESPTKDSVEQPAKERLPRLEDYFNAYTAPDPWVYYLASWFDLEPLYVESSLSTDYTFGPGIGRLRLLILAAIALANERGTYRGLRRFLQVAIGDEAFQVIEDKAHPFQIKICYPSAASVHLPLIKRIVEMEKPAYVHATYQLIDEKENHPPQHPPMAGEQSALNDSDEQVAREENHPLENTTQRGHDE